MKIGILVNTLQTAVAGQTTYRLAAASRRRGHEVWIISAGNFSYDPDDNIRARGRKAPENPRGSFEKFVASYQGSGGRNEWIAVNDLDVVLLRNNPSAQSPWGQSAAVNFGRLAMRRGVVVLNDPNGLAKAMNKMYLQTFPQEIRPRTLITRNKAKLRRFARDEGTIVIKPLVGSGGKSVFVVRPGDLPNMDEMIRAVSRDGYVVAQEFLPAALEGDTRLFLMNGTPLQLQGKYAAFRRQQSGGDIRSNIHAGGRLARAKIDENILRIAEIVRPRLVEDGMFLVGLDIVGDRVIEINVFTPGGLGSAQKYEKVDFTNAVVDALERKVAYVRHYQRKFRNLELATL